MFDKPFRCRVVSPSAVRFDGDVTYVRAPMWDGKTGFIARTGALVGRLGAGELRLTLRDGQQVRMELAGGFIRSNGASVVVLA